MLWGCFSAAGVGPIIRLERVINGDRYRQLLEETFFPFAAQQLPQNCILQHDNAPCHTARTVQTICCSSKMFAYCPGQRNLLTSRPKKIFGMFSS
jgi:hypothetical protein